MNSRRFVNQLASVALATTFCLIATVAQAAEFAVVRSFTGGADTSVNYLNYETDGSKLYGTSGANLLSMNLDASGRTVLRTFSGAPAPYLAVYGPAVFGTTAEAGGFGLGSVWRINKDGTGFQTLASFPDAAAGIEGFHPVSGVREHNGVLHGVTYSGGNITPRGDGGTAFRINPDGTAFTPTYHFSGSEGIGPGDPIYEAGDRLYVVAPGTADPDAKRGALYEVGPHGGLEHIHTFTPSQVPTPEIIGAIGDRIIVSSRENSRIGTIRADGTGFLLLTGIPDRMMIPVAGRLYGTTQSGGTFGFGTVFSMLGNGSDFRTEYSFPGGAGGRSPQEGLLAVGHTIYGTTTLGGAGNVGVVYTLTVPEPSSLVLAGVGLASLAAFGRRRLAKPGRTTRAGGR